MGSILVPFLERLVELIVSSSEFEVNYNGRH